MIQDQSDEDGGWLYNDSSTAGIAFDDGNGVGAVGFEVDDFVRFLRDAHYNSRWSAMIDQTIVLIARSKEGFF